MKRKPFFILFACLVCFTVSLQAQNYSNAVGARLGSPTSVSYKAFINDQAALEGYAGFRWWSWGSFTNVSGAYLMHNDIVEVPGLQWYYGGGASVFFWNYNSDVVNSSLSNTSLGIQGYLGIEYTFDTTPISLSLDWVPTIYLGGDLNGLSTFGGGYGSLGVRYVIGR